MSSSGLLQQAIEAARSGRKTEARDLLLELVEVEPRNEMAWMWLSGLVDALEDKIIACENVLTINPANEKVRSYLRQLIIQQSALLSSQQVEVASDQVEKAETRNNTPQRQPQAGPMDLAAQYEEDGKLQDALAAYREQASRTKDPREFDLIYKQIVRLEGLQNENIQHVTPSSTIARLTFTWPLLYFFLVLVQVGLNPFAHPAWYLWIGLPIVALGSFLLALADVRSRHKVWQVLFEDQNAAGSTLARVMAAIIGWILVGLPHVLLLFDSLNRLDNFQIPPMPF